MESNKIARIPVDMETLEYLKARIWYNFLRNSLEGSKWSWGSLNLTLNLDFENLEKWKNTELDLFLSLSDFITDILLV